MGAGDRGDKADGKRQEALGREYIHYIAFRCGI